MSENPTLYLDRDARRRIAVMRKKADARPVDVVDWRQLAQDRTEKRLAVSDPTAVVLFAEGYSAVYAVEDWPNGRFRRLTVLNRQAHPLPEAVAMLMREFGLGTPLSELDVWHCPYGKRGHAVTVYEEILGPEELGGLAFADAPDFGEAPEDDE
jgi:hypothetical protein